MKLFSWYKMKMADGSNSMVVMLLALYRVYEIRAGWGYSNKLFLVYIKLHAC